MLNKSTPPLFRRILNNYKSAHNIVALCSNSPERPTYIAIQLEKNSLSSIDWKFGYISYDYKNKIEKLSSHNYDHLYFPEKHFFQPDILFIYENEKWKTQTSSHLKNTTHHNINFIKNTPEPQPKNPNITVKQRVSKKEYLEDIQNIKEHIKRGDIYEVNYCHEFYAENAEIDPLNIFLLLNNIAPEPMSCYVKNDQHYILSSSPERYFKKEGRTIISQPIKGTIARGKNNEEDKKNKNILTQSKKDLSENIMIVDLVRNDLSKIAKESTVKVNELCKIYEFSHVYQMISTICAKIPENTSLNTILQATFPMGSMTGAPKYRAMELIDKYEKTKRGIYSGSVGYIDPEGNMDFNVVIRSILYNKNTKYLSFMVGGAITFASNPEQEYQETLLKAKALLKILQQ